VSAIQQHRSNTNGPFYHMNIDIMYMHQFTGLQP